MKDNQRYSRQMVLPELGVKGQARLAAARVLMIGAGGLGCPALLYLAGAGIGTIGIIDHDDVDETNLHRQVLFHDSDQGQKKASAARMHLLARNPGITIHAYDTELTDRNAPGLFSEYDVIIDGTDNFPATYLINDAAVKTGKPVIYGAIQGFEGQVSVFDAASGGPCYRCLYPQEPRGIIQNCAEAGVIGALPGIIGTMQAMEAVKIIIGHPSFQPLRGKLWMIDTKTMETRSLSFSKKTDCPVCAQGPENIALHYASPVCSRAMVQEIESAALASAQDCTLIDVREQDEWDRGHITGALHLPLSAIKKDPEIFSPHRQTPCVLYCQRGMRSRMAAEILLQAGFTDISSLSGGYETWLEETKS